MANTAQQRYLILFKSHSRATTKAETSTSELSLNFINGYGQTSGQTLDNYRQGLSVGLARSEVTQHGVKSRTRRRGFEAEPP